MTDTDWTEIDNNHAKLKQFLVNNEPNKNIIECISNKIILLYSFKQFNKYINEINNYKKTFVTFLQN